MHHFARGMAFAATGKLDEATAERTKLAEIAVAMPGDRIVADNQPAKQLLVFARPQTGRVQWIFASDKQQPKPGVRTGGLEKTSTRGVEALEVCEPTDKRHDEVGLAKTKPRAKGCPRVRRETRWTEAVQIASDAEPRLPRHA